MVMMMLLAMVTEPMSLTDRSGALKTVPLHTTTSDAFSLFNITATHTTVALYSSRRLSTMKCTYYPDVPVGNGCERAQADGHGQGD